MSDHQSLAKSEEVKNETSEQLVNESSISSAGASYDFGPGVTALKSAQAAADDSPSLRKIAQLQALADATPSNQLQRMVQLQAQADQKVTQTPNGIFQLQAKADARRQQTGETLQRQENKTGLPDPLKSGVESLSGISLDDVKVHRNSDKPAQLQAHAYAQGTDIHLGPGQEKHLPHEAWHVVQQKQGRVQPTTQLKGKVNINDDAGLEKEADVMGAKALQFKSPQARQSNMSLSVDSVIQGKFVNPSGIIQKQLGEDDDIWSGQLSVQDIDGFFSMFFTTDIDISILSEDGDLHGGPAPEVMEDDVPVDLSFIDEFEEEEVTPITAEETGILDSLENKFQSFVANGAEQPNLVGALDYTDALKDGVSSSSLNTAAGSRDQAEYSQGFDYRGETPTGGEDVGNQESISPDFKDVTDASTLGVASAAVSTAFFAKNLYEANKSGNSQVQKDFSKDKAKENAKDIGMQASYVFIPQVAAAIAAVRAGWETVEARTQVAKLKELKVELLAGTEDGNLNTSNADFKEIFILIDWLINKKERKSYKKGADTTAAVAATAASSGEVSGVSAGVAVGAGGSVAVWRTCRSIWKKFVHPGKRQEMAQNLILLYKKNKKDAKLIMDVFGITEAQITDKKAALEIVMDAFKS